MKYRTALFLLLVSVMFSQCFTNRCGDNIELGSFEILPASKAEWFPYSGVNELIFSNGSGDLITLPLVESEDKLTYTAMQHICDEGFGDSAEEYFMSGWLYSKYEGVYRDITYSVLVILSVEQNIYGVTPVEPNLYDKISYSTIVSGASDAVGGSVALVAGDRGNSLDYEALDFLAYHEFAEEIGIGDGSYRDVWYFNREWPATVFTPSIYVQKGKGIIAFLGLNGELWYASNPA